jgi:Pin2-interacting protein X1
MAKNSQAALNEILGIAPSASSSTVSTPKYASPAPALLSSSEATSGAQTPELTAQQETNLDISTSTKSVADYFAEKLAARKKSNVQSTLAESTIPEPSSSTTLPDPGENEEELMREERQRKEERREKKKRRKEKEKLTLHDASDSVYPKDKRKDQKRKKDEGGLSTETVEPTWMTNEPDEAGPKENADEGKKKKKKRKRNEE